MTKPALRSLVPMSTTFKAALAGKRGVAPAEADVPYGGRNP